MRDPHGYTRSYNTPIRKIIINKESVSFCCRLETCTQKIRSLIDIVKKYIILLVCG